MALDKKDVFWGLGVAFFFALLVSCVLQMFVPFLAKLPGLILCSGGELELVMRRRTSYGVCRVADGARQIGYLKVLVVSQVSWWAVFAPIGIFGARAAGKRGA